MSIEENSVFNSLHQQLAHFKAIRHDLHKHPETAFEEHRTAGIVAEHLKQYGLEVHTGLAGTGVVGVLHAGNAERAIGLRADLDALDLQENNTFAHRSTINGKMHGCGHDGHTTMLLAAAQQLAQQPDFDGTVYFIFQPAEENEGGAKSMIEAGLLKRFPMEAVFGMHNIPGIPLGEFAVKPGPMMAGYDIFEIKVKGTGGHAAFPQVTNDAIVAAASLVNALQTVVSRIIDPLLPAVLSVTAIQAGTNFNILPETATINGTVRYFDPDVQNLIEARLRSITKQILAAHGCDATVNYERRYPATINSAAEAEFSAGVLSRIFGNDKVNRNPTPMMGSEDFAFMLGEIPGCYIWAGNGAGKGSCMIHNPEYDFNDELIPYGATYWVELVREYLRQDPA